MKDASTSTLESVNADLASAPVAAPLEPLRPSTIRARRRPRAIALVYLFELVAAVAIAAPLQAWARAVWGAHPDGDAPVFQPGGQGLLTWIHEGPELGIVLRTTAVAVFVVALLAPIVTGATGAALATAEGRRGPRARATLRLGLAAYFPLLVVGVLTAGLQLLGLGLGVVLSSGADHRLADGLGEARSFLVRLAILAVFVAGVLVLGVLGDLARMAVVRAVVHAPDATSLVKLRHAATSALATARRSLGKATVAWAWRAVLSALLVVLGGVLGDLVGGRAGGALAGLFVAHQALVLARAALRTSWLANALRLL